MKTEETDDVPSDAHDSPACRATPRSNPETSFEMTQRTHKPGAFFYALTGVCAVINVTTDDSPVTLNALMLSVRFSVCAVRCDP